MMFEAIGRAVVYGVVGLALGLSVAALTLWTGSLWPGPVLVAVLAALVSFFWEGLTDIL